MPDPVKRILILMSDTGGGHRASAEALEEAFSLRYPGQFNVEMLDLWISHTPPPLNRVPKAYRFLVDDLPRLHRFLYEAAQQPQRLDPLMRLTAAFLQPFVGPAIRERSPDLIISVHPLMQEIPLQVLAKMRLRIPFVTVVTDLVTIPLVWFDRSVDLCFVPSDEGYRLALHAGLEPKQLRQVGLPIRSAFSKERQPKPALRRKLGMDPDLPAALIIGGGEGMGRVADIARLVADRLACDGQERHCQAGQLVVICGRNAELQASLEAHAWPVPVVVRGYVDDVWNWMAACDCVVTKAGPGSIAESLALGLPLLLADYVRGQETGNVPYVLKNAVGVYVEDPWQIAEVLSGWFGPQWANLKSLARNARGMGRPEAASQIVEEIAGLAAAGTQHST